MSRDLVSGDLASGDLVTSPPVLMAPRSDGLEVAWAITAPARGWLEWRRTSAPDTIEKAGSSAYGFVPQGTEVLRVRLDGLAPGTEIELRTVTESKVDDRRHVSEWKRFRSLDPTAQSSTFVVWNDTHQHDQTIAALDDASPRADVWVWNGDVCNNWYDPAELIPTLLTPAGRDVTNGRPLVFNWGNHDVRGPWAYRVPEIIATPQGRPFQAFRIGPVAVIMLNTGEDKPDDHPMFEGLAAFAELRREQASWLAEQIQQPGFVDAPYRVVFCHLPMRWLDETVLTDDDYANGRWDNWAHSSRELWHDSLVAWGTQVVISGHNHRAVRIDTADGFPYAQLLGGGPRMEEATWIEGAADAEQLVISIRRLDGSVAEQISFTPLS